MAAAAPQQAAAAEKIEMPVSSLSTFEKADQRKQLLTRAQEELRKVISKADAPQCCRHVICLYAFVFALHRPYHNFSSQ